MSPTATPPAVSNEARALIAASDVIDLHVESFSFFRALGYDPSRRHGPGIQRGLLFGQADLPRLVEAGFSGSTWVLSANPLRPEQDRASTFRTLLADLHRLLEEAETPTRIVRDAAEYRAAIAAGEHAAFVGVQGGNALPADPSFLSLVAGEVLRITLMHMTDSGLGPTSTPFLRWSTPRLKPLGYAFVEAMNHLRIGVDLAHMHPTAFWDVVRVQASGVPLLVTHTGVRAVFDHFRNLDDEQLKAIAATGGVVGIMYHSWYLGDGLFGGRVETVARHVAHAVKTIGDDHVALGSDWDGLITTPRDMPTCAEFPRLVQALLDAGLSAESVRKILGENYLRVIEALRPSSTNQAPGSTLVGP